MLQPSWFTNCPNCVKILNTCYSELMEKYICDVFNEITQACKWMFFGDFRCSWIYLAESLSCNFERDLLFLVGRKSICFVERIEQWISQLSPLVLGSLHLCLNWSEWRSSYTGEQGSYRAAGEEVARVMKAIKLGGDLRFATHWETWL